jgi:hypothetical protein
MGIRNGIACFVRIFKTVQPINKFEEEKDLLYMYGYIYIIQEK